MDWSNLISSVAFPIVACIAMAWYVKYQTDQNNQETAEMRKEHRAEVEKMTEALNNNTIAIERLVERMGRE